MPTLVVGMTNSREELPHAHDKRGHGTVLVRVGETKWHHAERDECYLLSLSLDE